MAFPQLFAVNAFDASAEHTFKFSYIGNQSKKNRLIIYDNSTNEVVYDKTIETLQLQHTLEANTLTNGVLYAVAVECFDKDENSSGLSNKVIFYCFDTPTFEFSNIPTGLVVINSIFQAVLSYSQPQGEELNSYQFYLYDHTKNEIYKSGLKYDISNMYVNYSNLEESNYYARAIGETLNGMNLDTGYIPFEVEYEKSSVFNILDATNEADKGRIKLAINVIALEGRSEGDISYIDNDMIDLGQEGSKVIFDKGFNILNNFAMQLLWVKSPIYNKDFMIFEGIGGTITLRWEKGTFDVNNNVEKSYIKLSVKSVLSYIHFSNYINAPTDNQRVLISLKKINNVYELTAEVQEV